MSGHKSRWTTSIGLLNDVRDGHADGWQQFVHLYTPLIYYWCRQAGLQEADAADVCQEAFRGVASGMENLNYGGGHSFRGWLWTVVRRCISRHFERINQKPVVSGGSDLMLMLSQVPDWVDDDQVPVSEAADAEVIRRAAELIRSDFAEHTWQAFWMSTIEELPAQEIAERLGMTSNGVRQAKFRVLARLREFLGFH